MYLQVQVDVHVVFRNLSNDVYTSTILNIWWKLYLMLLYTCIILTFLVVQFWWTLDFSNFPGRLISVNTAPEAIADYVLSVSLFTFLTTMCWTHEHIIVNKCTCRIKCVEKRNEFVIQLAKIIFTFVAISSPTFFTFTVTGHMVASLTAIHRICFITRTCSTTVGAECITCTSWNIIVNNEVSHIVFFTDHFLCPVFSIQAICG